MRRHAKAPSAGSSMRQGSRLGRIVRGASAIRGASGDADGSGAPSHRRLALTVLGAALLIALAIAVATAGASKSVVASFGSEGSGDGQLGAFPAASATTNLLAVNSSGAGSGAAPGDLYVADTANKRVVQFGADGSFIRAFGWGVDDGSDAFQVCTSGCQAGVAPGTTGAAGALPNPRGIAVDPATGNVFVDDQEDHRITAFNSDGTLQGVIGYGVGGGAEVQFCAAACSQGTAGAAAGQLGTVLNAIAFDPSSGDLYVADRTNIRVDRFDLTLDGSGHVTAAAFVNAFGWAVDTGAAAFETCTVASTCQAGSSGDGLGQFVNSQPSGLAVSSTGVLYTAEISGSSGKKRRVQAFTPAGPTYTPAEFAPATLTTTVNSAVPFNVAVGASGHVFVLKKFEAGATPSCPNGNPSVEEQRLLEFDAAGTLEGTHLACAGITGGAGLAANSASGRIFLASSTGGSHVLAIDDVLPAVATIEPVTGQTATTATLKGTVDPEGFSTTYRFEYSADGGASWQKVASDAALGSGSTPIVVEAAAVGLLPNTAYQARLLATNGAGTTTAGPVSFATATEEPLVSTAATVAGEESADLHGLVNPRGSNVSDCHFQWGATASYGNVAPCEALPGAGQGPKLVSAHLDGLATGATYHYRLLATNGAGTATGPDRAIEVGAALPDHRAWEMVSPPDKHGGTVLVHYTRARAAQQLSPGEPMAFNYQSTTAFGDAIGTGIAIDYLAIRDAAAGRWRTHAITPKLESPRGEEAFQSPDAIYDGEFAPDLSRGVFMAPPGAELTPDSAAVTRAWNLYLRDDLRTPGLGDYRLVSACPLCEEPGGTPLPEEAFGPQAVFVAASEGFTHVAFDSFKPLTADAVPLSIRHAYEWENGQLRVLGRVPVVGARCDDEAGPACAPAFESGVGAGRGLHSEVISRDGSRILFHSGSLSGLDGNVGSYFIRFAGHASVNIGASENTAELGAPNEVAFWAANPDLTKLYFTTSAKLVNGDPDTAKDLYRYDVFPLGPDGLPDPSASHLTRISVDSEPADGTTAVANGALGTSADGDTVYFFASGQLVAGAPLKGNYNLYRWHDGDLRWVGNLGNSITNNTELANDLGIGGLRSSRVSPDGEHLLFSSQSGAGLTGYQHGFCGSANCRELYLYSAQADGGQGELACASCSPTGAAQYSDSSFVGGATFQTEALRGAANASTHINHPLTDDGRYVYFDTGEPLAPQDINGVRDVYRYDSENGDLKLLSSGEDAADSYFLDASADGTDVFFDTSSQLSGWDYDTAYDAYDARIDGGLPEPPALVPACQGDACQPAPNALNDPTPASSSFQGAGNVSERRSKPRCPKGKRAVKARGKTRCVPKARKHHRTANHNRRASR